MMKKTIRLALLAVSLAPVVLASCQGGSDYGPSGTIPEEWIREAWVNEGGRQSLQAWLKPGPWIQRELFPCQVCYGFHGDIAVTHGPAHIVPDSRETVMCPQCDAVGRLPCRKCGGRGGTICDVCNGFGMLRCPDPKCSLVKVVDVVEARNDWSSVEKKLSEFDDATYMAPDHEWAKPADRGEIRYTARNVCPTCRSKGWIDCKFCRAGVCPCDLCRGTGLEKVPCPRCRGHRWILPPDLQGRKDKVRTR